MPIGRIARTDRPPPAQVEICVSRAELPLRESTSGRMLNGVDDFGKKIYLVNDDASYLSEQGLAPMQFERKVATAMVYAMDRPEHAKNAGWRQPRCGSQARRQDPPCETGRRFPKQFVAAVARSEEAEQRELLSHLTAARRSADVEQAYLNQG